MNRLPSFHAFQRKANWVIALVSELMSGLFRFYARCHCGRGGTDPRSWRSVLIVGDNHIGDILYRSSSLAALKAGLPNCEIYYLTAMNTAALLENNPALKAVLPWARTDSPLDLLPQHMAELKAFRFDAVLSTNAIRYWPELLLAIRLGVPNRVGYVHKGFSGWVTHPMPFVYPQPYPAYFRNYVAALTKNMSYWSLSPQLHFNSADHEEAEVVWSHFELEPGRPVIACFMTTRQQLGALPAEMVGKSLCQMKRLVSAQLVLLGSKEDEAILSEVNVAYNLEAKVIAGRLGLRALAVFLHRCHAVLTPDSGPRHLANISGIPVFFFRNLAVSCVETGSYVDTEIDLCPSDIERLNALEHRRVLSAISPVEVAGCIVAGLCWLPDRVVTSGSDS